MNAGKPFEVRLQGSKKAILIQAVYSNNCDGCFFNREHQCKKGLTTPTCIPRDEGFKRPIKYIEVKK